VRVGLYPHFTLSNQLSEIVGFALHRLWLRHCHLLAVALLVEIVEDASADEKTHRLGPLRLEHFAESYAHMTPGLPLRLAARADRVRQPEDAAGAEIAQDVG
jgi:hypothetical protein